MPSLLPTERTGLRPAGHSQESRHSGAPARVPCAHPAAQPRSRARFCSLNESLPKPADSSIKTTASHPQPPPPAWGSPGSWLPVPSPVLGTPGAWSPRVSGFRGRAALSRPLSQGPIFPVCSPSLSSPHQSHPGALSAPRGTWTSGRAGCCPLGAGTLPRSRPAAPAPRQGLEEGGLGVCGPFRTEAVPLGCRMWWPQPVPRAEASSEPSSSHWRGGP